MNWKVLALCVGATICWLAVGAFPQSLGSVATPQQLSACPTAGFAPGMTCYSATVSCPSTVDIPMVFGFYPGTPNPAIKGTIVLLPGEGGTNAGQDNEGLFITGVSYDPLKTYPAAGYNVVELAWGFALNNDLTDWIGMPWEDATNGCASNCNPPHNIQAAACRPATFLKYIANHSNYHTTGTGMCAQGFSGGSGAVAYTMAWYGGTGFLDKVVLISGPVFSNIELGCEVPGPTQTSGVCSGNPPPSFCPSGNPGWNWAPYSYASGVVGAMKEFTGDQTCRGTATTSPQSDQNWLNMSIVEGNASFDYSSTVLTGFSCGSLVGSGSMNNSSTQGWTFFNNPITTFNSPTIPYYLYETINCTYDEGVYDTTGTATVPAINNEPGFNAILEDMTDSNKTQTQVCQSNPR